MSLLQMLTTNYSFILKMGISAILGMNNRNLMTIFQNDDDFINYP